MIKTLALGLIVALGALCSLGCHCNSLDCYNGPEALYTVTTPDRVFPWRHVTKPVSYSDSYLSFRTEEGCQVVIAGKYIIEEEGKHDSK